MKIAKVEAVRVSMPTRVRYEEAGGTYTKFVRSLVIRLHADDGTVGTGDVHESVPGYTAETLDTMHAVVVHAYAPALVGTDLDSPEALHRLLVRTRRGNGFARCAVEMAAFDALARSRGQRICALLGGPVRTCLQLVGGIGIDAPDAMAERARAMVGAGYRTIKLKVGTGDPRQDLDRVRVVRRAIGDGIPIRVDANAGYAPEQAFMVARGLADLGIEHFEQPVAAENFDAMARLVRLGAVPIMADESVHTAADALRIVREGAADGIKIKISKVGGYIEARRIIDIAEAAGVKVILGNGICSSIEAASEVHLACAFDHVHPVTEMVGPAKLAGDIARAPFDLTGGTITLPEGPGHGMELSEARLREFTIAAA